MLRQDFNPPKILNAPIIPIFAVVLSATSALGMMIWRTIYFLLSRKAR